MAGNPIAKSPTDWLVASNLRDYDRERSTFSWAKARRCAVAPGAAGV